MSSTDALRYAVLSVRSAAVKLSAAVVAAIAVVVALGQAATAAPGLPANTGCDGAAVVAKLSVLEDRAAANMLAEALDALSAGGAARCLIDGGDPSAGATPSQADRNSAASAATVYVVGGPAALPDSWLGQQLGVTSYVRIAGSTRWGTQEAVAAAMVSLARGEPVTPHDPQQQSPGNLPANGPCTGPAVLVKLGVREDRAAANMLVEALSAIDPVGNTRCLIDVGDPRSGVNPTQQAIAEVGRTTRRTVIGGSAAIPQSWLSTHFGLTGVDRLSGIDRWATQAVVATEIVSLASGGTPDGFNNGVFEDHVVPPTTAGEMLFASTATSGELKVAVFICAEASTSSRFTHDYLDTQVRDLNEAVSPFFLHQSSGETAISFVPGDIIDGIDERTGASYPDNANRAVTTDLDWDRAFTYVGADEPSSTEHSCIEEAKATVDPRYRYIYVLIDLPLSGGGGGFAGFDGYAIQPSLGHFVNGNDGDESIGTNLYHYVVAHELGHSVLLLCHPHSPEFLDEEGNDSCRPDHRNKMYVPELTGNTKDDRRERPHDCSVMSYCGLAEKYGLVTSHIWFSCGARQMLGWGDGPPTPYGNCASGDLVMPGIEISTAVAEWPIGTSSPQLVVKWNPSSLPRCMSINGEYQVSHEKQPSWWNRGVETGWLDVDGATGVRIPVEASSEYTMRLRYRCGPNWVSKWSDGRRAMTGSEPSTIPPASVPGAVDRPSVSGGSGSLTVTWLAPSSNGSAVTGYAIRWRPAGGTWSQQSVASSSSTHTVHGLSRGSAYEVQVRARNRVGWGPWSPSATATTQSATSVSIGWGTDATGRPSCTGASNCRNLTYSISGMSQPYTLSCRSDSPSVRDWTGTWSGRAHTGCYFSPPSNGSYQVWVEINGVRSNTLSTADIPRRQPTTPARVNGVSLFRGAPTTTCANYSDISKCAWFDIDLTFSGTGVPASVTISCHTRDFNNDRAWLTRTVTLTSSKSQLRSGTSTEIDRVCRYAYPHNQVYVTVDGVRSNNLAW